MSNASYQSLAQRIGLTDREAEALKHRLDVPDAIADALEDYHPEDVAAVAERLADGDWADACSISEAIARAVLAECVEGSTWLACAISDGRPQAIAAAERVIDSLARKVAEFIGRDVVAPRC